MSAVRSPGRQMVINLVFMGIRMYLRIGHSFSTLGWYLSPCILIEILHRWYQELLLAPIRWCTLYTRFCSNGSLYLQVNMFHYCLNIDGIQNKCKKLDLFLNDSFCILSFGFNVFSAISKKNKSRGENATHETQSSVPPSVAVIKVLLYG